MFTYYVDSNKLTALLEVVVTDESIFGKYCKWVTVVGLLVTVVVCNDCGGSDRCNGGRSDSNS